MWAGISRIKRMRQVSLSAEIRYKNSIQVFAQALLFLIFLFILLLVFLDLIFLEYLHVLI